MQTMDKSSKMFEDVKSKHKSPLQKLPTKKEPTMNASAISKLLFGYSQKG
jgi:hypothetical protein